MLQLFLQDKLSINIILDGDDIYLRSPKASDYQEWADIRAKNKDYLTPWTPAWTRNCLDKSQYIKLLKAQETESKFGTGRFFFIFDKVTDKLIGGINLTRILGGVVESCTIGYWIAEEFSNKGLMSQAIGIIIEYCQDKLNLHRIEAACMQENIASQTVLKKHGFEAEGLAKEYLKINGKWQDHIVLAKILY